MIKIKLELSNVWNDRIELLALFHSKTVKGAMERAAAMQQHYVNNGTVNDYTTFARAKITVSDKNYYVCNNGKKLIYDR